MAGARIALGAELDIASGQELQDTERRLHDAITGSYSEKPIWRKVPMSALSAAGPDMLVSPVGPSEGRVWHVTRLAIGIDDDHTTLAGASAALYIASNPGLDLLQCEMPGLSPLPYLNLMGDERVIVMPGQFVYIVAYGITASHQIWATYTAAEYSARSTLGMRM